jgi:EAL domain-containing protein (putative c-di-GMP-specific phosphodiesterase class I)
VETREQLEFLRRSGCNEVQGFLYSRPLPPAEFSRSLAEQGWADSAACSGGGE